MAQSRVHVVRVVCKREAPAVIAVVQALDPGADGAEISAILGKLPEDGSPNPAPWIPSSTAEQLKLEPHYGEVIVEGQWNLGKEDAVRAALERLVAVSPKAVSVNRRSWTSARQALAAWNA